MNRARLVWRCEIASRPSNWPRPISDLRMLYLNSNTAPEYVSPQVPSELLTPGAAFTFELRLRNFFGSESMASFSIWVDKGALPSVFITAGSETAPFATRAPNALTIFASAAVAICPGSGGGANSLALEYLWTFRSVGNARNILASESVDPRYFKLPAFALNATQSYIAAVTVTDVSSRANNSASLHVNVRRSALRAVIGGGDRVIGLDMSGVGTPLLTLDASASVDIDVGSGDDLAYAWSCTMLDRSMGGACGGNLASADSTSGIAALNLTADYGVGTFEFTVLVTKEDAGGRGRNASASVTITTEIDALPQVTVQALDPTLAKANPSERLIIVGTVGPVALAVDTSWSLLAGVLVGSASDDGLEVCAQHSFSLLG